MQFAETNVLIAQMQDDTDKVDELLSDFYCSELEDLLEAVENLSLNIRAKLASGEYKEVE